MPEFTEPKNWPPNGPDLHTVDYSVWGIATDGVSSQNFRHIDQLKRVLIDCWAKPEHTEPYDRYAAIKTEDSYPSRLYSGVG